MCVCVCVYSNFLENSSIQLSILDGVPAVAIHLLSPKVELISKHLLSICIVVFAPDIDWPVSGLPSRNDMIEEIRPK